MTEVLRAFGGALRDLLHPRMLLIALLPMLAALALWLGLAFIYWQVWTAWADGWIAASLGASAVSAWLPGDGVFSAATLAHFAAWVVIVLLLVPLILMTAGLLAALLAMPLMVGFVAARDFPALERRHGGTAVGSFFNAAFAVGVFAVLWIVTLPLWLVGALGAPLALLLSAWLNQRLFFYDALAEHADADEYRAIRLGSRGSRYLLGVMVSALYVVPLANLFVPVLGGLAFTRLGLMRLAALRATTPVRTA